jgi:hypothetical protein
MALQIWVYGYMVIESLDLTHICINIQVQSRLNMHYLHMSRTLIFHIATQPKPYKSYVHWWQVQTIMHSSMYIYI